jgi:hypothetical protein
MNKVIPASEIDLLNAVADLFDEVDRESSDDPDTILREAGINPELLVSKILPVIQKELRNSPHNWRNKAEELQQAKKSLADSRRGSTMSRQNLISKIRQYIEADGELTHQYTLAFRNLESLSDKDLSDLASELEFLNNSEKSTGKK